MKTNPALPSLALAALLLAAGAASPAAADCTAGAAQANGLAWVVPAPELALPAAASPCRSLASAYLSRTVQPGALPVAAALPAAAQGVPVAAAATPTPAVATAAGSAAAPAAGGNSAYASDNRFNMIQNGQRMTADDFEAWMRARGIRIVPAPTEPAATPAPAATSNTQGGNR